MFCCTNVSWEVILCGKTFMYSFCKPTKQSKGNSERHIVELKRTFWGQDGAWRGGLQAGRDDEEHQQSWHNMYDCWSQQNNQDASAGYIPVYQFQRRPRTLGSTRPLGSLWSCSHLHPHTPRPHKPPSPDHIYRCDMALGSISDSWSRLFHPLHRNLCEKEQQLTSSGRSFKAPPHRAVSTAVDAINRSINYLKCLWLVFLIDSFLSFLLPLLEKPQTIT